MIRDSDCGKLIALLNSWDVEFKQLSNEEDRSMSIGVREGYRHVTGYRRFAASFNFDEFGKFKEIRVYE